MSSFVLSFISIHIIYSLQEEINHPITSPQSISKQKPMRSRAAEISVILAFGHHRASRLGRNTTLRVAGDLTTKQSFFVTNNLEYVFPIRWIFNVFFLSDSHCHVLFSQNLRHGFGGHTSITARMS